LKTEDAIKTIAQQTANTLLAPVSAHKKKRDTQMMVPLFFSAFRRPMIGPAYIALAARDA
jgi:hypothetical protein